MMEAKKRREEKEVEAISLSLNSLHNKAALMASGLNEKMIIEEQRRSESLMKELCSIRVHSLSFHKD